jgi:arylsulfatase A-like enzyme
MKHSTRLQPVLALLAALCISPASPAHVLMESTFDGSTGYHVFAGNTDNTSGSSSLEVNWTTAPGVTDISGLTAISTGDSGTSGGFAVTQNGAGLYANANSVYLSRNMNLDSNRATTRRGFSVAFTTATARILDQVTVVAEHTTNTGSQNQSYSSDLHYRLAGGGTVDVAGYVSVDYASGGQWHTLVFADHSGTPLPAGDYSLEVWMSNMTGGGAYAVFDGVSIDTIVGPAIVDFRADDDHLSPGESTLLHWEVDPGAVSVTIAPGVGDVTSLTTNGVGSIEISPTQTEIYVLTAADATGSNTASVTTFVSTPRPNIVVFLVDDMGPHDTSVPFTLDTNGVPQSTTFNQFYVTPNMESLAASGMRFVTAYAQSVCSPTRTGLMTGQNSARHAVSDWVGGGTGGGVPPNWRSSGMNASEQTLPKLLRQGGYRTIHIGKAHFGEDPLNLGFDVNIGGGGWGHPPSGYIGTPGYGGLPGLESYDGSLFLTEALTIEGNQAVENAVNEDIPFFLYMSPYAVHAPFTENPRAVGEYRTAHNDTHRKFATMIEGMDLALGEVRKKLVDLGVAEDTLIIFLGDNGSDSPATSVDGLPNGIFSDFPMRGKKGSKWEGGIRVPMIFSWAAANPTNPFQQDLPIPANSIQTDLVASWDLPTTLLGVAGLPSTPGVGEDGYDLRPYLRATPGTHRPQELVVHYPHIHRSNFFSLIRQGDMKLIYNYQANSHQLYDLAADPTESNDLAASQPDTVTRMARALAQRLDGLWGPQGVLKPTVATTAPAGNVVSIPALPDVDVDGDGLADVVEDPDLNGLVDAGETDPDDADSDDDLLRDGDEVTLGLNPLDAAEYFRVHIQPNDANHLQLAWPSQPGLSFAIRHSASLGSPVASWPIHEPDIAAMTGDETLHSLPDTTNGPFFSVELTR